VSFSQPFGPGQNTSPKQYQSHSETNDPTGSKSGQIRVISGPTGLSGSRFLTRAIVAIALTPIIVHRLHEWRAHDSIVDAENGVRRKCRQSDGGARQRGAAIDQKLAVFKHGDSSESVVSNTRGNPRCSHRDAFACAPALCQGFGPHSFPRVVPK